MTHNEEIKNKFIEKFDELEELIETYQLQMSNYSGSETLKQDFGDLRELVDACVDERPKG